MLTSPEQTRWRHNGLDYTSKNDIFSLPEKAADIIESVGMAKGIKHDKT
jgi:UDP-glucose:(heptosyl)LPS alpha-1,3-glucosyltransferase